MEITETAMSESMPVAGLDIGQAVRAMRENNKVARAGWNGKNMWLSLTPGRVVPCGNFWSEANAAFAKENGGEAEVLPYITMKTADNKIVPWLCSQTDLLATDWAVVE